MKLVIALEIDEATEKLIQEKFEKGAKVELRISNLVFQVKLGEEVREEVALRCASSP